MHCSDFCSDPMISRTYPDTSAHMLFWELNALLSDQTLSRKVLRRIVFLSSNQTVKLEERAARFFVVVRSGPRPRSPKWITCRNWNRNLW
jgi:hypothetical protein